MRRPTSRRPHAVLAALAAALVILVLPVTAGADQTISSAGPLTNIGISSQLNCSVNHTGDVDGEFFADTACGTLVASGGALYGPASIPAGGSASPRSAFTPVSQSAVTGTGTSGDPYKIVTVVDLGASGLQITETDSYIVGDESYRTDVRLHNSGNAAVSANIYRAADCYLQNSDSGFGSVDTTSGAVSCVSAVFDPGTGTDVPGPRIEQWLPLSSGSHYFESFYSSVWAAIGSQQPFNDSCACSSEIDNGAGLSWTVSVPAGGDVTRSHLITFSPLGHQPLTTSKTADADTANAGGADGYTITIRNPNAQAVTLSSITDTLPAGFSYTAGSSTGATTSNPTVNGQDLTWNGPFTVPAAAEGTAGTLSLHFNVTVASTPGDYFNNAGGASDDYTVAPTGDTAKITVQAAAHNYTISLSPASATNPVHSSHTVTATVKDGNDPVGGAKVIFSVAGVNPQAASTKTADGSGQAGYMYTGDNAGGDTITACFDVDGNGSCDANEPSTTASKQWEHRYALSLTPAGATNPVNTSHTVTATLTDNGVAVTGKAIGFVVTGVNPTSGSGTTNGSGAAPFSYTGTNAGGDTITACYDIAGDGCGAGDPTATATKTWTAAGDTRKPSCALSGSGTDQQGKKYIEVTVRDTGSGLKTVVVSHSTNTVNSIPAFSQGSTSPLVIRATKVNQSQTSTVEVTVTDVAGNTTVCDPLIANLSGNGRPFTQRLKGINPAERYVLLTNGRPGLRSVTLKVNGRKYQLRHLRAGQVVKLDIGKALRVRHNKVTVTMRGRKGAGALLVLHD